MTTEVYKKSQEIQKQIDSLTEDIRVIDGLLSEQVVCVINGLSDKAKRAGWVYYYFNESEIKGILKKQRQSFAMRLNELQGEFYELT